MGHGYGGADEFHAHLLDAIGEAVIVTDLDGTITYWNRAAEELYGWPAADVLGRSILDVTPHGPSRRQAEQSLRQSETRFQDAFAHAPVGMALTDLGGRLQYVNQAYCRIIGYREDELRDEGGDVDVEEAERAARQGFGLFSVRDRLDLFGGRMQIHSAPDEGTRVVLRVPGGTSGAPVD